MKPELQALIAEQKALTAKMEKMINAIEYCEFKPEVLSTTEESSTLDPEKVYIKGHPTRGDEVIKMLEDLGGDNRLWLFGANEELLYFLGANAVIRVMPLNGVAKLTNYTELHLPEEGSAENAHTTDIKVGDWYLLDEPCLKCELSDRMKVEPFVIDKISSSFDSDVAIVKFADGKQSELYKFKDKFHKVDPPAEEVELIEGEVYAMGGRIGIFKERVANNHTKWYCVLESNHVFRGHEITYGECSNAKIATSEQSKQLFDAIEKAGKYFDKENMRLLDVEEWSCERGHPVITRTHSSAYWETSIFLDYDIMMCDCAFALPYNDQTKHLIGTTNLPDKHYKFVEQLTNKL